MSRLTRLRPLAAALALAGAALARPAAAQDTIPRPLVPRPVPVDTTPRARPDTVPRPPVGADSTRIGIPPEAVRADTLPQRSPADTLPPDSTRPAPLIPAFELPPANGFSDQTWVFGPRELQYFHGLSVADLLERIPGLTLTRTGSFGQPLGVSPHASGGGRFRVFLDGYELQPLTAAAPDLQRIPLVNLQAVRIQRSLSEVRVDLTSLRLSDVRPFAQIEGADGDYDTRILRGIFTRPIGSRVIAEIGLDLVETDGFRGREPYGATQAVGRLSYAFHPGLGVQLEYRTAKVDRTRRNEQGAELAVESYDRAETILRARGRFLDRLTVEALVGRSRVEPAGSDTLTFPVEATQASVRAALDLRPARFTGGVRLARGQEGTWGGDVTEHWGRADFLPAPWLAATGEVRSLTLDGEGGVELEGTLRAGPWGGLSAFAQVAAGSRGLRYLADDTLVVRTIGGGLGGVGPELDTLTVQVFRTAGSALNGLRAGAEFTRGRMALGAAFVSHDVESWAPYGFDFDRRLGLREGDRITGVEVYGTVPVPYVPGLRLGGWYTRWLDEGDRLYLPTQQGRGVLEYNRVFRSGNLEPLVRVELIGRDQAVAPNFTTGVPEVTPRYALLNTYVQIRIIDIRIFWQFDNVINRVSAFDVPGTRIPGGRAVYGLRWFFRN